MSYIRCLSNPEGLYIWSEGRYAFIAEGTKPLRKILTSQLNSLLTQFNKGFKDDYRAGKYRLREIYIIPKQNRMLSLDSLGKRKYTTTMKDIKNGGRYQWRLSGPNWKVDMWEVTLEYIARSHNY